ncbi:hypothetical protein LMG27952_01416 [Paraburkholderia hiiakae]|uniref:Uncharacterized protein n=1 Tax=Paraburkholderia hiiakae TaxID=1081782 RepID=A0ABM8NES5_9BURK|nr:hypothetical protein [Paraburkholderia hiiakae]CAD6520974.1 hypothetical protein LMG27952_01416 [Paraburkholderia hiiakae]
MANKGSKGDFESAAKALSGRTATPAVAPDVTDQEREPPRSRPEKRREPLYAFIVHFDAEPSSKPLPPDYPDQQA